MRLAHLHLPNLTPYPAASKIQSYLVSLQLAQKTLLSSHNDFPSNVSSPLNPSPPPPTLLTFQTPPTYTCGRREIGTLSSAQIAHLTAKTPLGQAEFYEAPRGGQTTFHGPGQLVAYLVCELKTHNLGARKYVRMLEESLIEVLAGYGLMGFTTDNPGVWILQGKGFHESYRSDVTDEVEEEKIASVGVQLRRNVTSHGLGLNVNTRMEWFERIVACGLVGKRTTSLEKMGVDIIGGVEQASDMLARALSSRLMGVEGIDRVGTNEIHSH